MKRATEPGDRMAEMAEGLVAKGEPGELDELESDLDLAQFGMGVQEDRTGAGGGFKRIPPVLNGVWDSDAPHPQRAQLTFWYTASLVCLGLTMGAQGPAAIKVAEQCGFVKDLGIVNGTHELDTSELDLMGVATSADAFAGLFGCMIGAYVVERFHPWHMLHVMCMAWTGMAFIIWTQVKSFTGMLLVASMWGFVSVVPGQTTQAALTWIWGGEVGPYMNLLHAGFGLGSLLAPIVVSWDLANHESFHYAYVIIGISNILICIPTLLYDSPRPNTAEGSVGKTDDGASEKPTLSDKQRLRVALTGAESQDQPGGQWQMWFLWYSFFFWYASAEIGFTAWVSPYATILNLAVDCEEGFILSRHFSSIELFRAGYVGSILSLVLIGFANTPTTLWTGTALFGLFCGPMWPSSMSLLTEQYGIELRTTQLAGTAILTKIGIAAEQGFFSVILSDADTAVYFIHTVIVIMIIAGASHWFMMTWALPRSGLQPRNRKPQHMIAVQSEGKVSCCDKLYQQVAGL